MILKGDKEYRNLQEQVLRNQEDIKYLLEEGGALNEFGIKVVGHVNTASQLPNAASYDGEFGDAYSVGTSSPYTFYIYTRQTSGATGPYWFNIGVFPAPSTVPGPQGPQGVAGKDGANGSMWYASGANPSGGGYQQGDMWLNTSNGEVYRYQNLVWQRVGSIAGPQGIQGLQGATGATGPQGPIGPQGPQGENGKPFSIGGVVDSEIMLPSPSEDLKSVAYLVGTQSPYDLYVIYEAPDHRSWHWVNVGAISGVEGPAGPTGPQGPQGATGPQGPIGPAGPEGAQGPIGETGRPAGFGTIIVSTETVDYNRPADVKITPDPLTSNEEKGFNFLFKIPAGRPGEDGGDVTKIGTAPDVPLPPGDVELSPGEWYTKNVMQVDYNNKASQRFNLYAHQGPPGPEGPAGPTGPVGPAGPAGPQGIEGKQGGFVVIQIQTDNSNLPYVTEEDYQTIVRNEGNVVLYDEGKNIFLPTKASKSPYIFISTLNDGRYAEYSVTKGGEGGITERYYNFTDTQLFLKSTTSAYDVYAGIGTLTLKQYNEDSLIFDVDRFGSGNPNVDLTIRVNPDKYYNKSQIDQMISSAGQIKMEVVDQLPPTGDASTIYLLKGDGEGYDQYVYTDSGWKKIGSSSVDLSDYYTKSQTDNAISEKLVQYPTTSQVDEMLQSYVTNGELQGQLDSYVTDAELVQKLALYPTQSQLTNQILDFKKIKVVEELPKDTVLGKTMDTLYIVWDRVQAKGQLYYLEELSKEYVLIGDGLGMGDANPENLMKLSGNQITASDFSLTINTSTNGKRIILKSGDKANISLYDNYSIGAIYGATKIDLVSAGGASLEFPTNKQGNQVFAMLSDIPSIVAPVVVNFDTESVPAGQTSGQLQSGDLAKLQAGDDNYIVYEGNIYKLNRKEAEALVYSAAYTDGTKFYAKSIRIDVNTQQWTLVTRQLYTISVTNNDDDTVDINIEG